MLTNNQRGVSNSILLGSLTRFSFVVFSMPDLLSEVKLTVGEISRDLTELVHTFR